LEQKAALSQLSAQELFAEVIWQDKTFGPLLEEIKAAYEAFLADRGASIPKEAIALLGPGAASAARPSAPSTPPQNRCDASEILVDAARRRWAEEEDLTARGDAAKENGLLEKENAALRKLVKRLRQDLVADSEAAQKTPQQLRRHEASSKTPAKRPQVAPLPAALPEQRTTKVTLPTKAFRAAALLPAPAEESVAKSGAVISELPKFWSRDDAGVGQSSRSEGASTSSLDAEIEAITSNLWASREAIAQQATVAGREFRRPSIVPAVDLSRISDEPEYDQQYDHEDDGYEEVQEGSTVRFEEYVAAPGILDNALLVESFKQAACTNSASL
jgi:hypothetical protein